MVVLWHAAAGCVHCEYVAERGKGISRAQSSEGEALARGALHEQQWKSWHGTREA